MQNELPLFQPVVFPLVPLSFGRVYPGGILPKMSLLRQQRRHHNPHFSFA